MHISYSRESKIDLSHRQDHYLQYQISTTYQARETRLTRAQTSRPVAEETWELTVLNGNQHLFVWLSLLCLVEIELQ
jgi:hypothetical protein